MAGTPKRGSIFSQDLDRIAFIAYLLGAVVPLVALGVVVDRFVLPTLTDRLASLGLMGALASIAVLSLASFLTLRRTTRRSLERMDGHNRRLAGLLDASRGLADVEHATDAADAAARAALALSHADAAYIFVRDEPGAPPSCLAAAGNDAAKLRETFFEPLLEVAKLVMSEGRPTIRGGNGAPALLAAPLPGEGVPAGALVAMEASTEEDGGSASLDALTTLAGLSGVAFHNADLREAQRNFFSHVTDLLVSALDSQLGYHEGHGTRVAQFANRIGRQLALDEHRLQRLHFASLLHDIGMLKLSRSQQRDPRTSVKHTVLGGRMLGRIRLWEEIAPIVLHHHEWWDGSGYPEGLSGEEIPLESRIIAVCDVLDTLTSDKSYKTAVPVTAAVHEIQSCAGTQFDPDVVGAFRKLAEDGALGL